MIAEFVRNIFVLWSWESVVTVTALITGLILLWRSPLRDHFFVRNFGVVEPGRIYRSGRLTPLTLRRLRRRLKLRTVIDLGAYWHDSPRDRALEAAATRLGLTRHRCRGLKGDGTGNPNAYLHALRAMADPANHPVLIHCAAGADRTGAVVILYRVANGSETLEHAFEEARRHRHDPARNESMLAFVRQHADSIVRAFREGGSLPEFEDAQVRINPAPEVFRLHAERAGE